MCSLPYTWEDRVQIVIETICHVVFWLDLCSSLLLLRWPGWSNWESQLEPAWRRVPIQVSFLNHVIHRESFKHAFVNVCLYPAEHFWWDWKDAAILLSWRACVPNVARTWPSEYTWGVRLQSLWLSGGWAHGYWGQWCVQQNIGFCCLCPELGPGPWPVSRKESFLFSAFTAWLFRLCRILLWYFWKGICFSTSGAHPLPQCRMWHSFDTEPAF